ncbi:MAG: hypothetical protein NTW87_09785 [Planctomycetota bacterium]|nr:hypothetical protein [Planctomycetota bacterium]
MQPEVIANLWTFFGAFLHGQLNYQVGIRLYVATGTDNEKTAMLRTLAAWDFHLAHMFPPSGGKTVLTGFPGGGSMEVEGVMPANAPGMEPVDWCHNAFDGVRNSLPEHRLAGGIRRASLDTTNLLNVHTPVDVDKNGNMTARTSDPQLARSKPTVAANLWAFAEGTPACVHALAGRAYLLAGGRADIDRTLKNLAANDWLAARPVPVPASFSATLGGQVVSGRADVSAVSSQQDLLFAPVFEQIEKEIPVKHADWAKKMTHRYVLPREQLIRRALLVPEGGEAVEMGSAKNRKWWNFWK